MFVLCVCADVIGVKHNMEIAFPFKPSMDELRSEVERLFRMEIWAQDKHSTEDFVVARFMIYQEVTRRWAELKLSSQLKEWVQLYATQNRLTPGQPSIPPPPEAVSEPLLDDEYEERIRIKDRERARERERELDREWERDRALERERLMQTRERESRQSLNRHEETAPPSSRPARDAFYPPPPTVRYLEKDENHPSVYPPRGDASRSRSRSPKRNPSPPRIRTEESPPPPLVPSGYREGSAVRSYVDRGFASSAGGSPIVEEQSILTHEARLKAQRQNLLVQEAQLSRERDEFIARTGRRPGEGSHVQPEDWEVDGFRR